MAFAAGREKACQIYEILKYTLYTLEYCIVQYCFDATDLKLNQLK